MVITQQYIQFIDILTHSAEIKDFNVLIDNKPFYDQTLLKINKKNIKKLIEMSKAGNFITGNLLDYSYYQNYCILIETDKTRASIANESYKTLQLDLTTLYFSSEKRQKKLC